MAKFNIIDRRRINYPAGPVTTVSRAPDAVTHEGAPGWARDPQSELFLLASTHFVGERTFYESASARDDRYNSLVRQNAVEAPDWFAGFAPWLRTGANIRTGSWLAAAEGVHARLAAGHHGGNRQLINATLQRADEPGELLAYWIPRYGRNIPQPVKDGVADAIARLYTERSLLKYDSPRAAYRFGDVIELVRPKPTAPWRSALYEHAIARRHRRAELFRRNSLPTLLRRRDLMAIPVSERRTWLEGAVASGRAGERMKAAGMTWEALSGWLQGPWDATAWTSIIPTMGVMALVRNLRNFDEAGISDAVAEQVCARISDPAEVAQSRMFPYRWLAAYENAPSLRWGHALDKALRASLANLPAMPGRSLILVDTSMSMSDSRLSRRSTMTPVKAAAIFGVALAAKGEQVDLYGFADGVFRHEVRPGASVIEEVRRFTGRIGEVGHGTAIAASIRRTFRGHDRVFVISDMQTMGGYGDSVTDAVPRTVPLYGFNLQGYAPAAFDAGSLNRIEFGGLTDATFSMIPLIERGARAAWPWEDAETARAA
ncbi:TROVE domain-containing protein [Micromonospora fluostatini]|uniref:TROVE domain-containing protein n=1 Tax=Micromonospora fluostatini TaxID=1629071 RepID=A0ABY2DGB8_9ACTN|nr:TROVE domain-containing protein [Micromonospora fluostatini]